MPDTCMAEQICDAEPRKMRIVTTVHRAGWKQYGERCWKSIGNWPCNDIHIYAEGFDAPVGPNVTTRRNEDLSRLVQFKAKWNNYIAPSWRYDVSRFANKVYAMYDALYDYDGIGVWMDADIIAHKPIPAAFMEMLLPPKAYIAMFKRDGYHSESGLYLIDCSHKEHKAVLDTFLGWYESGRFREAHEWHDCVLMDATIRAFEREHRIVSHNLSGSASHLGHPMAKHPIAKYIDHLKGPDRKKLGYSPEREQVDISKYIAAPQGTVSMGVAA